MRCVGTAAGRHHVSSRHAFRQPPDVDNVEPFIFVAVGHHDTFSGHRYQVSRVELSAIEKRPPPTAVHAVFLNGDDVSVPYPTEVDFECGARGEGAGLFVCPPRTPLPKHSAAHQLPRCRATQSFDDAFVATEVGTGPRIMRRRRHE